MLKVLPLFILFNTTLGQTSQWRLLSTTTGLRIGAIDIFSGNPDTLYAISNAGLLLSADNGETWNLVTGGESVTNGILSGLKIDPHDSRRVYVSHSNIFGGSNDLSMTTDGGATWLLINPGGGIGSGAVVEIDPSDYRIVYAGVGSGVTSILRTTDRGTNWNFRPHPIASAIFSLSIDAQSSSNLYASYSLTFFRSPDTGATWEEMNFAMPLDGSVTRILIHPITGALYATCWPFQSNPGGVFISTDTGKTWVESSNGLGSNNRNVFWMSFNQSRLNEAYLCVGSPSAEPAPFVFFSADTGHSWIAFSKGLPTHGHAEQVVTDTANNRIFASVFSGDSSGIYVFDLTTSIAEGPLLTQSIGVFRNFPNPFNATTTIQFVLPNAQYIEIAVFNLLGQHVSTIVEGWFETGFQRVTWDADGISSGVYVCRLKGAGTMKSIFVTLVK